MSQRAKSRVCVSALPVIAQLRDGYGQLGSDCVTGALRSWLPAWRAIQLQMTDSVAGEVRTMAQLGQRWGIGATVGDWFDDLLHVGRWVRSDEACRVAEAFDALLSCCLETFVAEPLARVIYVGCVRAHRTRTGGDAAGAEAAFAALWRRYPDHAVVMIEWVKSRLDAAARVDLQLLRSCETLLQRALDAAIEPAVADMLGWALVAVRADIYQAELLGGDVGRRGPWFQVHRWPAPLALWRLQPALEDAFCARWGAWFDDAT